jgi:hypothetical protein
MIGRGVSCEATRCIVSPPVLKNVFSSDRSTRIDTDISVGVLDAGPAKVMVESPWTAKFPQAPKYMVDGLGVGSVGANGAEVTSVAEGPGGGATGLGVGTVGATGAEVTSVAEGPGDGAAGLAA